jgi:endogenous inhibitor of DNA gyrase (YacG/DUF329 family)
MARCLTCRGPVPPREENAAYPFCSPRCRAVDLGRWFIGEYRVPGEKSAEQPAEKERPESDPEKH